MIAGIHIEFDPVSGRITLDTSHDDMVMNLGLLERAKALLLKQLLTEEESPLITAPAGALSLGPN